MHESTEVVGLFLDAEASGHVDKPGFDAQEIWMRQQCQEKPHRRYGHGQHYP